MYKKSSIVLVVFFVLIFIITISLSIITYKIFFYKGKKYQEIYIKKSVSLLEEKKCNVLMIVDNKNLFGDLYRFLKLETNCKINYVTKNFDWKDINNNDYIICLRPLNPYMIYDISKKMKRGKVFILTKECFDSLKDYDDRKNILKNFDIYLDGVVNLTRKDIFISYYTESSTEKINSLNRPFIIFNNISIDDYTCGRITEYIYKYKKYGLPISDDYKSYICRSYNTFIIGMYMKEAEKNKIPINYYISRIINDFEKNGRQ